MRPLYGPLRLRLVVVELVRAPFPLSLCAVRAVGAVALVARRGRGQAVERRSERAVLGLGRRRPGEAWRDVGFERLETELELVDVGEVGEID